VWAFEFLAGIFSLFGSGYIFGRADRRERWKENWKVLGLVLFLLGFALILVYAFFVPRLPCGGAQ
jgi:cytochrome c oxidase assembly factor CtaG